MKTRLLEVLPSRPTFNICCVCKKVLGYRLDSPCLHRDKHLLYSHGYCESCAKQMKQGVKKAYRGSIDVQV